jgi:hypothetical protein
MTRNARGYGGRRTGFIVISPRGLSASSTLPGIAKGRRSVLSCGRIICRIPPVNQVGFLGPCLLGDFLLAVGEQGSLSFPLWNGQDFPQRT